MHDVTKDFLQTQYQKNKLLRHSDKGEVWLVNDEEGTPAVMREINHLGIPGRLLMDNPCSLWPRIIYFAEDEEEQKTIMVEEYVIGKNMQELLRTGRHLSEDEAKALLAEFCKGLSKLHSMGIVHRDIKPNNIVRQPDGAGFKLIDFDAARLQSHNAGEQDTMLLGTKGYAPPEQYGYSQTDCRSDIYALGVTVDELLGAGYKGYLRPVIRKCRALDPAMRYQSAEDIIRAINRRRLFKMALPVFVSVLLILILMGIWIVSIPKQPDSVDKTLKQQIEKLIELPSLPENQQIPIETPIKNPDDASGRESSPVGEEKIGNREFQGNGINIETVPHGNGLSGGSAGVYYVSSDVYRYWPRENQDKLTGEYTVYVPADWYIDVVIKNSEWNGAWYHPTFDITYTFNDWDGNDIVSRDVQELPDIPSGGTGHLRIDLGGMKMDNVRNYYGPKIHIQPRWPENTKFGGWAKQIELNFLNDKGYKVWEDIQ